MTVVEIRGDKVRLGFNGPRDVPIHRREVYNAIHNPEGDGCGPLTDDDRLTLAKIQEVGECASCHEMHPLSEGLCSGCR